MPLCEARPLAPPALATRSWADAAPGALVYVDVAGVVRGWSSSAERLFGLPAVEVVGRWLGALVPFAETATAGWCVRGDGSRFYGELTTVALDGADGPVAVTIRDVTARHQADEADQADQAARALRERVFQRTASLARLVLFTLDVATQEVIVSGGFAETVGWTRGAPPRQLADFLALIHVEDRAGVTRALERAIVEQRDFDIDVRAQADRGERWLRVGGTFFGDGSPRLVGTAIDLTTRRRAVEAVSAADARLHAVLDAALDAILTVDDAGRIVSANRTAATLFRCPPAELMGAPLSRFVDGRALLHPAAGASSGALHAINGARADGSTFPAECGVTTVGLGAQQLTICVVRDLSERRLLERQLLEVSEQLQRQIGQDLHDGLGQLLTGTAFLAKGLEGHVADAYRPQAQRVVELINQAITRVRSLARGLSPIHVEAQSLEAVMRHVVAESSKLLDVKCVFELHDAVNSDVPATVVQLCLITREAITNAVRHGQAQRISVSLSRVGQHALLTIADDGVGIAMDRPASQPLEGLGLRSMLHRAHMIGGTLEVCRGPVRGTVVRCTFRE